jgi:hypothetical protein
VDLVVGPPDYYSKNEIVEPIISLSSHRGWVRIGSSMQPRPLMKSPEFFVFTDVLNEPDDSQSLVRLLLHADELGIQGLVATTSYELQKPP